jgi:molybdopterin-binding protein
MSEVRVSARNRLPGTIVRIKLGEVMAQVTIRVGRHTVDAVITRDSAEEMGLKKGDRVAALVKSTEIMVLKGDGDERA